MPSGYNNVPSNCKIKLDEFKAEVPQKHIDQLKQLLELTPIAPPTHENTARTDGQYGVSRKWAMDLRDKWAREYDWRKTEARINSYPNYTTQIKYKDNKEYRIHFTALFSEKADAIPLCLLHGWPGSILEFYHLLDVIVKKYSPKDLPYHIIVPSLPGYGYSGGPSVEEEWTNVIMAYMMNELMVGLGFGGGYITHGGDIGSFLSRIMAVQYDGCKAMHLHFCLMPGEPEGVTEALTEQEKKFLPRLFEFATTGNAYAKEHGTKGGTIGLVLASSPLATLCWIGEKYIEWTDQTPSDQDILDSVTLYWMTESFPRAVYPYIDFFGRGDNSTVFHGHPDFKCKKPWGYSYFPWELGPIPLAWAKTTGNLTWHKYHESGGHFAALEKPKETFEDIEEFVGTLNWKQLTS